jgi:hypothetical protein
MEHIVAAWDMAGLAIVAVEELAIVLAAEALVGRKIEEFAIVLAAAVVVAEALVGRKVEICP